MYLCIILSLNKDVRLKKTTLGTIGFKNAFKNLHEKILSSFNDSFITQIQCIANILKI